MQHLPNIIQEICSEVSYVSILECEFASANIAVPQGFLMLGFLQAWLYFRQIERDFFGLFFSFFSDGRGFCRLPSRIRKKIEWETNFEFCWSLLVSLALPFFGCPLVTDVFQIDSDHISYIRAEHSEQKIRSFSFYT